MASSILQLKVAYCLAMTLGGAAHCPNEQTLDPHSLQL